MPVLNGLYRLSISLTASSPSRHETDGWRGYAFLATGSIWDELRTEDDFQLMLDRMQVDLERMRETLEDDPPSI